MKAAALLCLLACAGYAAACAHTYTHDRGLLADAACPYNHQQAGWDWKAQDSACGWTCGGTSQSPINVPARSHAQLDERLRANTKFGLAKNITVLNLGHAIQVEWASLIGNQASVPICGNSIHGLYSLANPNKECRRPAYAAIEPLQFHFHGTSEHLLSGRSTQLELHIVTKIVNRTGHILPKECQNGEKCLAVFGVLYDLNVDTAAMKGDARIERIISALPQGCPEAGRECTNAMAGDLDLSALLPSPKAFGKNNWSKAQPKYSTYSGSLTTPPCSQGVMWHVFSEVKATLSYFQAVKLQVALSTVMEGEHPGANRLNNRWVLPLNGRKVFGA
ncbi:carbonic anhydrase [Chlorella sorokiniana]|uniref:carbonic anhydrase n=1 Tax=Chlorella sorokiniana TaxID=3076 RepID=A0A2P6U1K3_CHLSO|nr:carbonic anhydrase [Chlorella sorokiniana]|eukprot:PRW60192.1 carbonic anhydrase [Chlorella sorokiniana]